MVTAELAACLPVLVLVLAVAVSAVSVASVRVRAQDAAREAARAAARGDPGLAQRLAQHSAPGVEVDITKQGDEVIAIAHVRVRPLAGWLPALTVTERAVAAVEPSAASP
ncbi:MAG: TadE family type IV pilus minor pilin [Jatrophihabitantaceae bacterium]